jgi:hypothetical protein
MNNQNATIIDQKPLSVEPTIDENLHIFVYGSIEIKDVETGAIVMKKSF